MYLYCRLIITPADGGGGGRGFCAGVAGLRLRPGAAEKEMIFDLSDFLPFFVVSQV